MSLREKAREIKAAGEAERGNFTPQGKPLEVYKNYYLKAGKIKPVRENFCHFWRIVAIWAPLRSVGRGLGTVLEATFGNVWFLSFLAAAMVVAMFVIGFTFHAVGVVTLIALACVYAVTGLLFGAIYANDKYDATHWTPAEYWEQPESDRPKVDNVLKYVTWATVPVAWLSYTIVSVAKRLDKDTRDQIGAVVCLGLGAAILVFGLVNAWLSIGWWLLVVLAAAVGAVALIGGVVLGLGNLFAALRAHKRSKPIDWAARDAAEDARLAQKTAPREPGRLSRFFTAVADFLILATQIVRVNKWKICPIVTIDKDA